MRAVLFLALIAVASCYKVTSWNYYDDCTDFDNNAEWQIIVDSADWPTDWDDCDSSATDCYYDYYTFECDDDNTFDFSSYMEYDIYEGSYADSDTVIGSVAFYSETDNTCDYSSDCCFYEGYYIQDVTCDCFEADYTYCDDSDCTTGCVDTWDYISSLYSYDSWYSYYYNYFSWDENICPDDSTPAAYQLEIAYMYTDCSDIFSWVATPSDCTPSDESDCLVGYTSQCIAGIDLEDWESGGIAMETYCQSDCTGSPYMVTWYKGGCISVDGLGVSATYECDDTSITIGSCFNDNCDASGCVTLSYDVSSCTAGVQYICGAATTFVSAAVALLSLFALLA